MDWLNIDEHTQQCQSPTARASSHPRRVNATWDFQEERLLLSLMAAHLESGHRKGCHLSGPGYAKVTEDFNQQTGKSLAVTQIKSHIEKLRKEWRAWTALKSPRSRITGVGWDATKGTIDAPDHWWQQMAMDNPAVLKFREKGPDHEDLMERVFHGAIATGERHWTPAAGPATPPINQQSEYGASGPTPPDLNESSTPFTNDVHSSGSGKRRRMDDELTPDGSTYNRRRVSESRRMNDTLQRVADAYCGGEKSLHLVQNAPGCNMDRCIAKLATLPGFTMDHTPNFMWAADLLKDTMNRESFMAMPDDTTRVTWLHYQRMKAVIPPPQSPTPTPPQAPPNNMPPYYPYFTPDR